MSDRLAEFGPLIDAGPTREHVAYLRSLHISLATISRLAGVSGKALGSITRGVDGRPPARHVRQDTADRLLAVQPRLELIDSNALIGAHGTRRRIQALQAIGWTPDQIAAGMGSGKEYIRRLALGGADKVTAATAIAARDLYDRLWDRVPPQRTPWEQGTVTRMRRKAAACGWAPPMAWDDDEIDNPEAAPAGTDASPGYLRKLPEDDELLWLVRMGETDAALAVRFGAAEGTVKDARLRVQRLAREAVSA